MKHMAEKGKIVVKKWDFTYFSTYIFARTERKLKPFCKNKNNDLSF